MEKLMIGSHRFTEVVIEDEKEFGANHLYRIQKADPSNGASMKSGNDIANESVIHFQKGPVKENGINGCHQEDLLVIVIHRLQDFQRGPYACRENAIALTKIEEAIHWLNHRTKARQDRGIEGSSEK